MAAFMKAAEGYNIYPTGPLTTNYPWTVYPGTTSASIVATAGTDGLNCLQLANTSVTNTNVADYSIPSTAKLQRVVGQSGVVGVNFWLNTAAATSGLNAQTIMALGCSSSSGYAYPIVALSTSSGAYNLAFPTIFNQLSNSPFLFPISLANYYFISIRFAWYDSNIFGAYFINGQQLFNQQLTWTADNFGGTYLLDRIKYYAASTVTPNIDDSVFQLVSNNDADWPVISGNPSVNSIDLIPPTRIYSASATGNGAVNQWTATDGTTPNYQAATGSVGVRATDTGLTDLYQWNVSASATGVVGVVAKTSSTQNLNIAPQKRVGTTQSPMGTLNSGSARVIAISESDGTNPWTATSINAAQFGLESQ